MQIAFCKAITVLLGGLKITELQTKSTPCIFTWGRLLCMMNISTSNRKEKFNMATYSSKQDKRQVVADPIALFISAMLIGALVVLGPLNAGMHNSISGTLGIWDGANGVYSSATVSFDADQQYWESNCNHGWTSDSTCDNIFSRVQSCVLSAASPYCSSYEDYMQDFFSQ
jgi:hypothetical protein